MGGKAATSSSADNAPAQAKSSSCASSPLEPRRDFHWDEGREPHALRKTEILKAHPEIRELMGPDSNTKYQIFVVVAAQVAMACWASGQQWRVLLPVAYLLGGAANCNLQLGMHEISHNLAFPFTTKRGMVLNRLLSLVANLPLGIPAAISFRKYHLEHHRYQGHDVMDVDVPCDWSVSQTARQWAGRRAASFIA